MLEVGSFEAKTHFPELLTKVEAGEEYIITRRGKPVARLAPLQADSEQKRLLQVADALERMRKLRKSNEDRRIRLKLKPLGQKDIKAMIEQGRR